MKSIKYNKPRSVMIPLLLIFILNVKIAGQEYWLKSYRIPDKIASKTKPTTNLENLSFALTSSFNDSIDKYRAIFTWVALHISYDLNGINNPKNSGTDPKEIILKGVSSCEGYANLFQVLCNISGLPCKTISGWAKNFPSEIQEELPLSPTHTWNAIHVNLKWYLCDVTWASGYLNEETNKYVNEFNDTYFCTPPEEFSLNHYPDDSTWFLGNTISKETFINQPHFYSYALKCSIKNIKPQIGIIKYKVNEPIDFSFTMEDPVQTILIRKSDSNQAQRIPFDRRDKTILIHYRLESYAQFLYIYINNQGAIVYKLIR